MTPPERTYRVVPPVPLLSLRDLTPAFIYLLYWNIFTFHRKSQFGGEWNNRHANFPTVFGIFLCGLKLDFLSVHVGLLRRICLPIPWSRRVRITGVWEIPSLSDNLLRVLVDWFVSNALSIATESTTINGRPGISLCLRLMSPSLNFLNQYCSVRTAMVPLPSIWHIFSLRQ